MATSNRLLPLFKGQLEAESAALASRLGIQKRGTFLIHWYFTKLHDFLDNEVSEIICDGGGDLGIDAIWIDDKDLVHFYQFKNPEQAQKGIPAGEIYSVHVRTRKLRTPETALISGSTRQPIFGFSRGRSIDKMISGLRLILSRQHSQIANPDLRGRIDEIYQRLPRGYRIHAVSSGRGLEQESKHKLNALVTELQNPSGSIIEWQEEDLASLQERFYQQNLPAVEDPLIFDVPTTPYMLQSGNAECFLFAVGGGET